MYHNLHQWLSEVMANYSFACQLGLFLLLFFTGWSMENHSAPSIFNIKWKHALFNFKLFITDMIPQIAIGSLFIKIIQWTGKYQFGLAHHLSLKAHPVLLYIIAFATLDLGEYIYHVIMHKAKRLWMIHAIHHSDELVDISTVFREHPLETVVRNCFSLFFVFISGVTPFIFFIHLIVQKFFVLFSHTHIWIKEPFNKMISLLFITPNLHQVHHHYKQPYTDSNYGDILSIWDRLFGTFRTLPKEKIIFGLDYFTDKKKAVDLPTLLKYPFEKEG